MVVDKCISCNNNSEHKCANCDSPICDNCNHGTEKDEKCLCAGCKGVITDAYNEHMNYEFEKLEEEILIIKNKGENFKGNNYQYVRRVYAELRKVNFDITSVTNRNKTILNEDIISEAKYIILKKSKNILAIKKAFGTIDIKRRKSKTSISASDFKSLLGAFFS
jgi:hypothetical protein